MTPPTAQQTRHAVFAARATFGAMDGEITRILIWLAVAKDQGRAVPGA